MSVRSQQQQHQHQQQYQQHHAAVCFTAALPAVAISSPKDTSILYTLNIIFGVRVTEDATEHLVVIIDAGSKGINAQPPWNKSRVNTTVSGRSGQLAPSSRQRIVKLKTCGGTIHWKSASKKATKAWQSSPFLTKSQGHSLSSHRARILASRGQRTSRCPPPGIRIGTQTPCTNGSL